MEVLNPEEKIDPEEILLFFNVGYEWSPVFKPFGNPTESEYNFYWLHDRYYSHLSTKTQPKYLHIFVKSAKSLHPRWFKNNIGENTVSNAYEYFKKTIGVQEGSDIEPVILRCSATLIPDVVFEFEEEGGDTAVVIFPEHLKGVKCDFFDKEHTPLPFVEVENLVEILPVITDAVPVVSPKSYQK